jgi:hypothetical protein
VECVTRDIYKATCNGDCILLIGLFYNSTPCDDFFNILCRVFF